MSVCEGCENLVEGECRVFDGPPIPGADGDCRAKGWVWDEKPPPVSRITWVRPRPEALTAARAATGLSGQEVSRRARLPLKTVRDIENGRTKRTRRVRVEAIARVLGVEPERLVAP